MPNWVKTVVKTSPDVLKEIKEKYFNTEGLDFNKVIPMPEDLKVKAGSSGMTGLIILHFKSYEEEQKQKINAVYRAFNGFNRDIYLDPRYMDIIKKYYEDTSKFKEDIELGEKYLDNYCKYGYSNWYDWCIDNWGTKWNCDDFKVGKDMMIYVTAWDFADKIILKLSKEFPDAVFECKYSNEDYGSASGIVEIKNGELFLQNYDLSYEELDEIWNTDIEDLSKANEVDLDEEIEK